MQPVNDVVVVLGGQQRGTAIQTQVSTGYVYSLIDFAIAIPKTTPVTPPPALTSVTRRYLCVSSLEIVYSSQCLFPTVLLKSVVFGCSGSLFLYGLALVAASEGCSSWQWLLFCRRAQALGARA